MSFVVRIVALAFGLMFLAAAAGAQTVNVLVLQEDWDTESVQRDNRIQRATLIEFQKVLNAPSFQRYMHQFGIEGLDVYDETAVAMSFYDTSRVRRSDEELIQLARQIPNLRLDAMVLYTLYARAVEDPYTRAALLQASMHYRVLNVKSGQFIGGDTVAINTAGIPFTGCATGRGDQQADAHCVKEFVATHAQRMAADAANRIALQIGALLGQTYSVGIVPAPPAAGDIKDNVALMPGHGTVPDNTCGNIPTTYVVTYKGIDQSQMNAVEEYMSSWVCAMELDLLDSSLSQVKYQYKTRANQQRIVRNIRLMSELMGLMMEPATDGHNEIVVEAIQLRRN